MLADWERRRRQQRRGEGGGFGIEFLSRITCLTFCFPTIGVDLFFFKTPHFAPLTTMLYF